MPINPSKAPSAASDPIPQLLLLDELVAGAGVGTAVAVTLNVALADVTVPALFVTTQR